MEHYKAYMNHIHVSDTLHERLLRLDSPAAEEKKRHKGGSLMKFGTLAACAALLLGAGLHQGLGKPPVTPLPPAIPTATENAEGGNEDFWSQGPGGVSGDIAVDLPGDRPGFTVQGPGEGGKLAFPAIHSVDYADVTDRPQSAASIALPDGSFFVALDREDILALFWGPAGKPAAEHPKADPGDLPLMLMNWTGYTLSGDAIYDGKGDLWQLELRGEKGDDSFTLTAAPGRIPPTCVVENGATVTRVIDTDVSGWQRSYDRDGDGETEHVVTSELIAHGVGVRFQNIGSGGMKAGTDEATDLDGAILFNSMFVTQMCHYDGGLHLDLLAHRDDIPVWTMESYEAPDQALAGAERFALSHPSADFLPYLPTEGPSGYGEFHGNLFYQEGVENRLFVRWSKIGGYDDVEVCVYLPEDPEGYPFQMVPVDVSVPESYDWRLYDGAICDVVPEEYQQDFYKPMFRAADMSLEVVKARMRGKDTGGESCNFYVLHENGTAVDYSCSGVSAEYVWGLVQAAMD